MMPNKMMAILFCIFTIYFCTSSSEVQAKEFVNHSFNTTRWSCERQGLSVGISLPHDTHSIIDTLFKQIVY